MLRCFAPCLDYLLIGALELVGAGSPFRHNMPASTSVSGSNDHLYRTEDPDRQHPLLPGDADGATAVYSLLERLLPGQSSIFQLSLCDAPAGSHGHFALDIKDGTVHINGTSGVELASGVHWFLKHYCNSSISWDLTGGLQINTSALRPERLKELEGKGCVTVERAVKHTFYQNVVTLSYSMAFWDTDRWLQEVDWMALQGINLPLMPLGMEALWLATFQELGLTAAELEDFFPGPAFLAWGRMGNIQGYGGPLPQEYMQQQLDTAKQVVQRMRAYGMTPVYPAFAGFVPRALKVHYPNASLTPSSNWCHFPDAYSCPFLLDAGDPLYQTIGSAYITRLRSELGWDSTSYYIADSFNEMKPASSDPAYLRGISASVFKAMTTADAGAVWIMQAWLFFSDHHFWQSDQIKALLSGVPLGRLILLDLFADEHPVWSRTESLYGYPFIWCMLHNFGGNLETYGALSQVAQGVTAALAAAPNMVGVGMAPEGIEQNPAVYEFMAEMAFKGRAASAAADLGPWFHGYALRRYGAAGELPLTAAASVTRAWALIARSLYSCSDRCHNTVADIPTSRPGLSRGEITGWGLCPHLWYDVRDVRGAWEALLSAAAAHAPLADSSAFAYDLLDLSRELMSKIAGRFWADVADAYRVGDLQGLQSSGRNLLNLLQDMEQLLTSHKAFLLGPVLQRARSYASSSSTHGSSAGAASERQQQLADLYERNLRTQVTIWGTSAAHGDSEVSDYANREWSGLLGTFYLPRWQAWLELLQQDLQQGRSYDAPAWRLQVLNMTYAWIQEQRLDGLPLVPQGEPLLLARAAYERYGCLLAPGGGAGTAAAAAAAAGGAAMVPPGLMVTDEGACECMLPPTPSSTLEPMTVVA